MGTSGNTGVLGEGLGGGSLLSTTPLQEEPLQGLWLVVVGPFQTDSIEAKILKSLIDL